MKTKLEFAFSTQFDRDGRPIPPAIAWRAVETLRYELADLAGGCTAFTHVGARIDPDGKLLCEQGYTLVTVLGPENFGQGRIVRDMVELIKFRLNQAAVAVTKTSVEFDVL